MTWIDCRNFGAQVIGNSADSFHLVSNFSDIAPLGRHMLRILFPARSRCLHKPKTTTGHKDKAVHKERLTPSSVRASPFICASRNTYIRYFWKCSVETLAAGVKRNSFVSDGTFTWLMSDYKKGRAGGRIFTASFSISCHNCERQHKSSPTTRVSQVTLICMYPPLPPRPWLPFSFFSIFLRSRCINGVQFSDWTSAVDSK